MIKGEMSRRAVIRLKRVYEPVQVGDGRRFLVDRLWPRGLRKQRVPLHGWVKDAAPSNTLRRWFGHDPARWPEFMRRYDAELDARPHAWEPLVDAACRGPITLLFAARDTKHNNAVALRSYLMTRLRRGRRRSRRVGRANVSRGRRVGP